MSGSYNLRSSQRKKGISVRNCYLQNFSKNVSPEAFNPRVCLERLKLLECYDMQNSRFYVEKDRISFKKNESFLMMKKKCLLKIICIIILVVTSAVYWKDYLQSHSSVAAKKFSEIFPEFQNFYFDAIKFYLYDSKQHNHKEKKSYAKNGKSTISEEKFVIMHENSHIRKLIKDYLVEIKNIDKKQSIIKPSISFIAEQCSANLTLNLNTVKSNFYNSTFFDMSNLTDYALESQGAKIVTVFNTEPYGTLAIKFLNFNLWPKFCNFLMKYFRCFSSNGPNSVLIPWKKPGDCWAFKGSYGKVQIQLSKKIIIKAISIDHLSKEVAGNDGIKSAPKQFSVIGIEEHETQISKTHLGTYEYKNSGSAAQTFFIRPQLKVPFRKIEIIIESNHGNKLYTCVYKIRVHGHKYCIFNSFWRLLISQDHIQ